MRPSIAPAAAALLALCACQADSPTAVPSPLPAAAATALATFSADARARLLPTLPSELQPMLATTLTSLEHARTIGEATRSLNAAAELAGAVAGHPSASALALDLAAMRAQLNAHPHP